MPDEQGRTAAWADELDDWPEQDEQRGWDAHYATEAGVRRWPCEELVRWIGADARTFGAVVDVGAGCGGNVELLATRSRRVLATEPNDAARNMLERRVDNIDWLHSDPWASRVQVVVSPDRIEDMVHWPGAQADLVVDCMTSQHLPWRDHGAAYAEYHRVLEPGGWLWLYHLDDRTRCDRMVARSSLPHEYEHLSLFPTVELTCLPPRAALAALVVAAGFEELEARRLVREYPKGDVASYAVISARKPED